MRHKLISLLVAASFFAPSAHAQRLNQQIVITSGTAIRVSTVSLPVDRLFVQSRHNNMGLVYLMDGVATGTACSASSASQLTAELGPGDATHPGQSYSDPQGANGFSPPDFTNLQNFCVDGSNSGDVVIVSYYKRN
jgi:hypothetical protein